jgi:hypothetical protein
VWWGAVILKPYVLVNIQGYILLWKGKCSFREIIVLDSAEMICSLIWSSEALICSSGLDVDSKSLLKCRMIEGMSVV